MALADAKVMEIRHARNRGENLKDIADRYKISEGTVSRIVRGESYKHLPLLMTKAQMEQGQRAVTDAELDDIMRRWGNGESIGAMAEEYGISSPTLSNYIARYKGRINVLNERVMPDKGARYRDALAKLLDEPGRAGQIAREALGL